jgi:hypothetical protein
VAFKLLPFTPLDVTGAEAAALIEPLNAAGVLLSGASSELWTRWLLDRRNAGTITLHAALYLQRYILEQTGQKTPATQWANLSIIECLGQVDSTDASTALLRHLILNANGLHFQVTTGGLKTLPALRSSVLARQNAGKTIAGAAGLVYLTYLSRVGDALAPYLTG